MAEEYAGVKPLSMTDGEYAELSTQACRCNKGGGGCQCVGSCRKGKTAELEASDLDLMKEYFREAEVEV